MNDIPKHVKWNDVLPSVSSKSTSPSSEQFNACVSASASSSSKVELTKTGVKRKRLSGGGRKKTLEIEEDEALLKILKAGQPVDRNARQLANLQLMKKGELCMLFLKIF